MKTFCRLLLLIVILMTSFTPQAATAGWKNAPSHYILASNQQNNISEQAAVTIAKQHFNGRVLAINRVGGTYRIKILSDKGTVHIVTVNSNDGSISPSH